MLDTELRQLSRTTSYASRIKSIQDIASLMVQSNEDERQRFVQYRARLIKIAEVVALTADILIEAGTCETKYDLKPQDALVYASITSHLRHYQPQQACFLNRNFNPNCYCSNFCYHSIVRVFYDTYFFNAECACKRQDKR